MRPESKNLRDAFDDFARLEEEAGRASRNRSANQASIEACAKDARARLIDAAASLAVAVLAEAAQRAAEETTGGRFEPYR